MTIHFMFFCNLFCKLIIHERPPLKSNWFVQTLKEIWKHSISTKDLSYSWWVIVLLFWLILILSCNEVLSWNTICKIWMLLLQYKRRIFAKGLQQASLQSIVYHIIQVWLLDEFALMIKNCIHRSLLSGKSK